MHTQILKINLNACMNKIIVAAIILYWLGRYNRELCKYLSSIRKKKCRNLTLEGCSISEVALKNETKESAWEYWERTKIKRWIELSDEDKEKLIIANLVIADDIGVIVTKEQLEKMLEEQLPVSEPYVGLSYPIRC